MSTLGRYTLVDRIGAGGMAEIWKARTHGAAGFEKTVAIKRILPQFCGDPAFVDMFVAEAKLAQRLESANVVRVIDFGEDAPEAGAAKSYYLVMEYVAGQNLATVVTRLRERKVEFPMSVLVHVAVEAARGLAAAHRACDDIGRPLGLVHRDVSPQNILVSWQGDVKLSDFGIAKASTLPSVTRTGVRKGKVAWMSPEQAAGETLDPRSDLFSLGLVLYDMAAGRHFLGATLGEAMQRLASRQDPAPEELERVPDALREIVARLLRGDREKRFRTAIDVESALLSIRTPARIPPRELFHALLVGNFESEYRAEMSGVAAPAPPAEPPSVAPAPVANLADAVEKTRLSAAEAAPDAGEKTRLSPGDRAEGAANLAAIDKTRLSTATPSAAPAAAAPGAGVGERTILVPHEKKKPAPAAASIAPAPAPIAADPMAGKTGFLQDDAGVRTILSPSDAKAAAAPPVPETRVAPASRPAPNPKLYAAASGVLFLAAIAVFVAAMHHGAPPAAGAATPASPAASPTPPLASRNGVLFVESEPEGAKVFVDGRPMDVTPIKLLHQPVPHTFHVEVRGDGFAPWSREVDLSESGDGYASVRATLAKPAQQGMLALDIPAGKTVVVDGEPRGTGPARTSILLEPGHHQVRVRDAKGALVSDDDVVVPPGGAAAWPATASH